MEWERIENENELVTIASKVSRRDKEKLRAIAKALGLSFYELVQGLLLAMLRFFDSGSMISKDHDCMMDLVSNTFLSLKDSYNPLQKRYHQENKLKSAILFVEDAPKKRPQLISIIRNKDGQLIESLDFDTMVGDFLRCVDPNAMNRLEIKQKELGYFSITHTLHQIIMQNSSDTYDMFSDIKEMFSDMRIPSGQSVNDDIYYKRGYRKNVDEYTTITPNETYRADL